MSVDTRILSPKFYPAFELRKIFAAVYPEHKDLTNTKDIEAFLRKDSDELAAKWNDSDQTDFSVYTDPRYLSEGLLSFLEVSIECHRVIGQWRKYGLLKPGTTWFDMYSGVGVGTLHLAALGMDVMVYNNNPDQIGAMKRLFDAYGYEHPTIVGDEWRDMKFDVVSCFEVFEHYKDARQIAAELASCVKPNGFFFESTGYRNPRLVGHFTEYDLDGVKVSGAKALSAVKTVLRNHGLYKVFDGFNMKPRIWKNVGVGNTAPHAGSIKDLRRAHGDE